MIKLDKKFGQTPLEALEDLRKDRSELANEKLSYAGRLDPMATGEMLVLVGKKENAKREKYLKFNKTYEAHVLFGFKTDTGDLLGLSEKSKTKQKIATKDLKTALRQLSKIKKIKYPVFSSKTVKGKPLFEWYREGRIGEIEIPTRDIKIFSAKVLETYKISTEDLQKYVAFAASEVKGDFRQDEIFEKWMINLQGNENFQVAKIKFKVSSGTYIRVLAEELGKILGTEACLLSLCRTKIHKKFIFS